MTEDEVYELAAQCNLDATWNAALVRFANAIAAHEKAACLAECDKVATTVKSAFSAQMVDGIIVGALRCATEIRSMDSTMKAKQCDECAHRVLSSDADIDAITIYRDSICNKGHRPNFYQPKSDNPYANDWGWKRKCLDFVPVEIINGDV